MVTVLLVVLVVVLLGVTARQTLTIRALRHQQRDLSTLVLAARDYGKWCATRYFVSQLDDIEAKYPDAFIPHKRLTKATRDTERKLFDRVSAAYSASALTREWVDSEEQSS